MIEHNLMEPNYPDQQPQFTTGFQTPIDNYGSTILRLTNTEDELQYLELTLKGQYEDTDGKIVQFCEPMMNELGITSIMRLVRAVVNRITIMSNLEREIPSLMNYLSDVIIKNLMFNHKKYGIKDASTRSDIAFIVQYQSFMSMRRAFKEGDKRFLKGSTHEQNMRVQNNSSQGGIMKRFLNNLQ